MASEVIRWEWDESEGRLRRCINNVYSPGEEGTVMGVDICMTFDTTGSMSQCLASLRRRMENTVDRMFRGVPDLRMAILAHGDYCDAGSTYVVRGIDFSESPGEVCNFIRSVGPTDGGDRPECYEYVLRQARSLNWKAGSTKVLVMIGDDVPHEPTYRLNTGRIDWRNELLMLVEGGIHVYGVHAMPGIRQHSRRFYEEIARVTGGFYLTLDQFRDVNDLLLAVCLQQTDEGTLARFRDEVTRAGDMSRGMAQVFSTLTGERVEVAPSEEGLVSVPAGRFQVLEVDRDMSIRDFVEEHGLMFRKGRGFYQFTKKETIQERKEVVLMNRATRDMYSGPEAREMIGVPTGTRARVDPANLPEYVPFVQSTSYNRKLRGGTMFLYEVEDWRM